MDIVAATARMEMERGDEHEEKRLHTIGAGLDIRHRIIAGQQIWHNQITRIGCALEAGSIQSTGFHNNGARSGICF